MEGDTHTCSAVVSNCAVTIPNISRTAPAKSVFVCIFITGVVGSRGDTKKDKIAVDTVKKTAVCVPSCDASSTLL